MQIVYESFTIYLDYLRLVTQDGIMELMNIACFSVIALLSVANIIDSRRRSKLLDEAYGLLCKNDGLRQSLEADVATHKKTIMELAHKLNVSNEKNATVHQVGDMKVSVIQ